MNRLPAALTWLEDRAADLAGLVMFAMVFCVTLDVVMRYSLNAPLSWSYELVSMYLLPAIVFLPVALVQRQGHHVNVDIVYLRMSPGRQRLASAVSLVCAGGVLAIIGSLAAAKAWLSFAADEIVSGPIPWPVWIGPALLAAGAALFLIRCIAGLLAIAHGATLSPGSGSSDDEALHREQP